MHWTESIPRYVAANGKSKVTVWAGEFQGLKGLPPPPNSYGSNPASELAILFVELEPGGSITIPAAKGGQEVNRKAYFVEGQSLLVGEQVIPPNSSVTLNAGDVETVFSNLHGSLVTNLLILQGRPIGEPVAQQGPFVMNTMVEIQQAFADYRKTQFGGWPWPQNAMVFERSKGRFALLNGLEVLPPAPEGRNGV